MSRLAWCTRFFGSPVHAIVETLGGFWFPVLAG